MIQFDTMAIQQFNKTAGHGPISAYSSDGAEKLAINLIVEECNELSTACHSDDTTDEELFKEMLDVLWVIFSYCMRRGWDLEEGFHRLGMSNLSKFHGVGDGTYWAEYHPSGKVKKAAHYQPPSLEDLVYLDDSFWANAKLQELNFIESKLRLLDMDKYPA